MQKLEAGKVTFFVPIQKKQTAVAKFVLRVEKKTTNQGCSNAFHRQSHLILFNTSLCFV